MPNNVSFNNSIVPKGQISAEQKEPNKAKDTQTPETSIFARIDADKNEKVQGHEAKSKIKEAIVNAQKNVEAKMGSVPKEKQEEMRAEITKMVNDMYNNALATFAVEVGKMNEDALEGPDDTAITKFNNQAEQRVDDAAQALKNDVENAFKEEISKRTEE